MPSCRGASWSLSVVLALFAGGDAVCQSQGTQSQSAKVAEAAEKWMASDQQAGEPLDAVIKVMLEQPAVGIDWLLANIASAEKSTDRVRKLGVAALRSHFVLGFLPRQRASNMVFVGQYDALLRLQPFAGDLLFHLLLETPDWYPLNFRIHLVPALRDLQPTLPAPARVEAIVRMVENVTVEPEDLRRALAAMLWQWGSRSYAQAIVDRLQKATTEGDAEDRVQTTLELADYDNLLRDYKAAATAHRSAQALAKSSGVTLRPIAWYAAACVHSLLGDVEHGLAALDACATMQASPDLDPSLRVEKKLFDEDPELANLRRDPRFAAIEKKAFEQVVRPTTGH